MKIKTVAYKGSKRKLLKTIQLLAEEVNAKTFFDGFSGSGIVSAYMRQNGFEVIANDLNYSSYIYGKVFLEGYDEQIVNEQIKIMNEILIPKEGWITNNYSGEHERIIRGTNGKKESRPLGFTKPNAMKIDSARDYIKSLNVNEKNKNALTFSIILAADKVFNNINDQKSALKKWTSNAKASIKFESPTLIDGPLGKQLLGNILKQKINADFVYFDPPYTSGVLYHTSYHLNDSLAIWNKEQLNYSYAIPRPLSKCPKINNEKSGMFYSKKTVIDTFKKLLKNTNAKRIVLSYSDAPRNAISYEKLIKLCKDFGNVSTQTKNHQICTQPSEMNKISNSVKEFFIIIDKKITN